MLEYGDTIFVSPVVDHFAKEKHGDVLLPRGLRVKEAVAFRTQLSVMPTRGRRKLVNLAASRGQNRVRQACSSSSTVVGYNVRHIPYSSRIPRTYLYCIAHDGLTILNNEAEVWVMESEQQGLRANAAADIDNQRTLRKIFPGIPCRFDIYLVRSWGAMQRNEAEPSRMESAGVMFFAPFMAAPNRARRNLLSGASNQVHISPSKLCALLKAVLLDSYACPSSGSRRVSVR